MPSAPRRCSTPTTGSPTRFLGRIDYYNAKPPLNVWLIALSFKTLGISALSLRLVSVTAAGLTVLVLVRWMQAIAGPAVALVSGLVLATSFGFIDVHSARTANTDALYTLLILLTAVVLYRSVERRWDRLWLGPLLAAVFLLRGPAVLMPMAIILLFELWNYRARGRWIPLGWAAIIFAIPSGLWMFARWRVDQWSSSSSSGASISWRAHSVSSRITWARPSTISTCWKSHQYEWLIAGAVALMLFPPSRQQWTAWLALPGAHAAGKAVLACWGIVALIVPTLMQTKAACTRPLLSGIRGRTCDCAVPRRGNGAGQQTAWAGDRAASGDRHRRGHCRGEAAVPSQRRDADRSLQGFLQSEAAVLAGHTVFRSRWNHAERFVVTRLIGANIERLHREESFVDESDPGDFLVTQEEVPDPRSGANPPARPHPFIRSQSKS